MKWLRWAVFFFFLIPANKITNNFYISWFGVNHTLVIDYVYHWGDLLAIKHQVLCPGLCEPFHSCLFEVYYLSQTTKFRPFNVNEALWLSGSGRLLLQSLFSSQSEQLLNVVAPLCYTCKDTTTQAGELNIGSVAQDKTETCTQSMHEIDYVQLSVLPFNLGPV